MSQELLVRGNTVCLSALTTGIITKLEMSPTKVCKILFVNGFNEHAVFEVYSSIRNISKVYPSVPNRPQNHCLLKLDKFIYCIGGFSAMKNDCVPSILYRLNLSNQNLD